MIKVGVIGSGFGLYGLLPAFNSVRGCKVVSICGKNSERLLKYCKSIGLEKIYTSWEEMLDNENLDAIAIAVTPNAQYEISKTAIKRGIHIFAEKPLTANLTQAKELLNLANKKKIKTAVDFIFPEIEEWRKLKEIIDKKSLGKLMQINLSWDFQSYNLKNNSLNWKNNTSEGGGALAFYFSHSLYYLEYFAGKILKIKSSLNYGLGKKLGETGVDLLLKFENNISGTAHLNSNAPGLNRHQLTFIFESGTVVLENDGSVVGDFNITIYKDGKEKKTILNKIKKTKNEDERVKIVKRIAKRFINAINKDEDMTPSFKEGVRIQELIEKVRKNAS